MGRKGVSKQKSKQPASKPQSGGNASHSVSSEQTPLVKSFVTDKADNANNRKQNSKKG